MGHVLATELSTQADVASGFKERLFEFDVTECTTGFVARGGQIVIVVRRGQLHRQHRAFNGRAADHESDVIRRTSSRTQRLHLFNQVGNERSRIQNGLRFLIQIRLVGRTTALDDTKELVFVTFAGFDVDLSRQVALRVLFFVHRQRGVLGITQAVGRVGFKHALGEGFFIAETGPDGLTLFTVDDGRTRILAEGQFTLSGRFSVAQEGKCDILIVVTGFRIVEDLGNGFVVGATQHEVGIMESLFGQ